MRSHLIFGFVMMAGGCATAPSEVPPVASGVAATRQLGELALAQGRLGFAPCTGEPAAAIDNGGGAIAGLLADLNEAGDGSAFVDADIAREADGRWRVDRIHRAYRNGSRCLEDPSAYVWRASGADGAWTLEVTRRYVTLRRKGHAPTSFRYQPFAVAADGSLRFDASTQPPAIGLRLRHWPCRDPDARLATDWSVVVAIAGQEQSGCAWRGMAR